MVLAQVLAHDEVLHRIFLTGRTGEEIGARLVLVPPAGERRCARDEAGQYERQCAFLLKMADHVGYSGFRLRTSCVMRSSRSGLPSRGCHGSLFKQRTSIVYDILLLV